MAAQTQSRVAPACWHGKKSDRKTKCGRRVENAYVWLEGALSAWTKCARCWRGKLISTRGEMAEAIDARLSVLRANAPDADG